MDTVEFFKTFAGPIATVVASATAAWIAWRLGSRQVSIAASQAITAAAQKDIAQSQRDIAYDRLKYDLFRMRYEIYQAAKSAIERVIRTGTERPIADLELQAIRVKLDEGRFFFPSNILQIFDKIDQLVQQHEIARLSWDRHNENDEIRASQADIMADAIHKLSAIHRELPGLLQDELGFEQLVAPGPNSTNSAS